MVYETFLTTIHGLVQERLRGQAEVSMRRVLKNNGLLLDGLTISSPDSRLSPTVYLNSYYQEAEEGLPLSIITDQIILLYEEDCGLPDDLEEQFHHFEAVRDRIAYRLINAKENQELLKQIPHIPYLDLAIVFYLIVAENQEGQMTALIHNHHLAMWDLSEEELGQLAEQNTLRLMPAVITPIEETLLDSGEASSLSELPPTHLYVVTNQRGLNGASALLYPDLLRKLAERLEDDLLILPSSIHEVLVTPCRYALPYEELNEMIALINQAEVPQEERLANHIYCYSRSQSCLYIPKDASLIPVSPAEGESRNPQ